MYLFALTAEERQELRDALVTYVTELSAEISHTEGHGYSEELKSRRAVLEGILRRLAGAMPVEYGPGGGPLTGRPGSAPAT
jgi:hypothetical protein